MYTFKKDMVSLFIMKRKMRNYAFDMVVLILLGRLNFG